MLLDQYKQKQPEEVRYIRKVTVLGLRDEGYGETSTVVAFFDVPIEEVTPAAITEILLIPGVDFVQIGTV